MSPAQWFWLFQQMGMPTGATSDQTQPPGLGGPNLTADTQDTGGVGEGVDLPPVSLEPPTTAPYGSPSEGGPGSYPEPPSTSAYGAGPPGSITDVPGGEEPLLDQPGVPSPPGIEPDVASAIPLSSDEETLLRGGVSGPLYPTQQDVFPQPSMFDELGRPTNWAGAGQFFRDAAGNIVENIMNDPGYSSPQYLSSIGYRQDFPGGAYWPTSSGRLQVPGTYNIGNLGGDAVVGANALGGGAYDRALMQHAYKGIFMSPGQYGQYLAQAPNAFGGPQPSYRDYVSRMRALQAALKANPQLMGGGQGGPPERGTRGTPPPAGQ